MTWYVSPLVFLFLVFRSYNGSHDFLKIQMNGMAQGTTWHITYYAKDSMVRKAQVDSILNRIDSSLSIYKPFSLISRFNASKKGIVIDDHFAAVAAKSIEAWQQSDGLFDITVQPLVQAWGFSAKPVKKYPDSAKVRTLLRSIGTDKIKLEGNRLIKTKPCITIDVDGIAQGYSVDVVADFLEQHHITDYIVEIGGEIRIKGRKKPGNEKMKIGIEAPGDYGFDAPVIQKIIAIDEGAVTTSGNYRKFHESNGEKFSHTIDTRTGYPTKNNLVSVTVFAKDAITADAYDNVLMTMGLEKALIFTEKREDIAAYFIYKTPSGTIADTASSRFYGLFVRGEK
ncbi:FAD:protein FMN transferase [Agriterribacter sp.]|uniref:FAD:protein FMN transferase n=1 Tax=Agriterribacter sp. TaxID=2821509 RepID=UPI002D0AA3A9|nr:FAD:protein FMN transferase [Agriterribacter sp.]HTN09049.1 FAD:protein FMN transferase [Agriterribacter sp.]